MYCVQQWDDYHCKDVNSPQSNLKLQCNVNQNTTKSMLHRIQNRMLLKFMFAYSLNKTWRTSYGSDPFLGIEDMLVNNTKKKQSSWSFHSNGKKTIINTETCRYYYLVVFTVHVNAQQQPFEEEQVVGLEACPTRSKDTF